MRASARNVGLGCAVACALPLGVEAAEFAAVDVELLASRQLRNRAQVPNEATATRFSIEDIQGAGPYVAGRLQLVARIGERQEIRALVAPLTIEESGTSAIPIRFQGAQFSPGNLRATYQFDSYRITWRWRWIDRDDLSVKVGFTAKLRDARIELRQGTTTARKDDVGFVPLAHLAVDRRLGEQWSIQADVDALGGGPGYAIDAGARLSYALDRRWKVGLVLRVLDGGADSDEVYSFARFASVGLAVTRSFGP